MDISLNSGERICDKCNGEGIIVIENIKILEKCKHCNGEKIITWIDDVIGKNNNNTPDGGNLIIKNILMLKTYLEKYCRLNGLDANVQISTVDYKSISVVSRGEIKCTI